MINIPKNAKIKLDVQGSDLKAFVTFPGGDVIKLDNVDTVNTVLRNIYEKESCTLRDLINNGRLTIGSTKVWDKYNATGSGFFCKVAKVEEKKVEKAETVKKEETVVKEEKPVIVPIDTPKSETTEKKDKPVTKSVTKEEKPVVKTTTPAKAPVKTSATETETKKTEKSKSRIKLNSAAVKTLAVLAGLVVAGCGIKDIIDYMNKKSGNNSNNNNYRVDINDNGNTYSYNLTDEDIVELARDTGYVEDVQPTYEPPVEVQPTYVPPVEEYVPESVNYDSLKYGSLGSIIEYDDMATQLDVIDNKAIQNEQFEFQNLVVPDDYDVINAINNMRHGVINGNINRYDFMNSVVQYVFNGNNYLDQNFVESYRSLHPYAKYIVVRISQGILQICDDNELTNTVGYDKDNLIDSYDNLGSDLYVMLTQNAKQR